MGSLSRSQITVVYTSVGGFDSLLHRIGNRYSGAQSFGNLVIRVFLVGIESY